MVSPKAMYNRESRVRQSWQQLGVKGLPQGSNYEPVLLALGFELIRPSAYI